MVAPASGRFASTPVNDKEGNRWSRPLAGASLPRR
jgi:hypothetical protein